MVTTALTDQINAIRQDAHQAFSTIVQELEDKVGVELSASRSALGDFIAKVEGAIAAPSTASSGTVTAPVSTGPTSTPGTTTAPPSENPNPTPGQ